VLGAASLHLALWAGPEAVLAPFRYQLGRTENVESLYHFIVAALPQQEGSVRSLFLLLQVALALAAPLFVRSHGIAMARWMAAMTIAFVVFGRFQSPQWVLWITPLALLATRGAPELGLLVAIDVLAYVYFPIAFDVFGPTALPFAATIWTLTALRLTLALSLVLRPAAPGGGHALTAR
jgi:hypothetical protein